MPAGWPAQTHLELAALPSAVACARGHVRSVAELVTNAVRASERLTTAGPPVVRLWLLCDQVSLVIQVWDGHEEMPVRRDATPEAESGRGLMLVSSLAKDWGTYREASGKVVWVRLS
jgi:anti-sigma regulatory factor (Ser/Thr protein kinase)